MEKQSASSKDLNLYDFELLQKEKKNLQQKFKSKYLIFQSNIFQILTLFPQVLLKWDIALITLLSTLFRNYVAVGDFAKENTMMETISYHKSWINFTSSFSLRKWVLSSTDAEDIHPIIFGYHSLLMSFLGNYLFDGRHKSWFTLKALKFEENLEFRSFLKFTVCLTDSLMFIPPAIWFAKRYGRLVAEKMNTSIKHTSKTTFEIAAIGHLKQLVNFINSLIILLQPTVLLIDHAFFGYHGFTLGALLLSINNILDNKLGGACVFYILAIFFDQNCIVFAPVFIVYFLKMSIFSLSLIDFASIVFAMFMALVLFYFPLYLYLDNHEEPFRLLKMSLLKLCPLTLTNPDIDSTNFWIYIKALFPNRNVSNEELKLLSMIVKIVSLLPTCIYMFKTCSISRKPHSKVTLLYGLASCSLSFYLFSYEFDCTSIVLPMLPLTLLIVKCNQITTARESTKTSKVDDNNYSLHMLFFIQNMSMYSIWPLIAEYDLFPQYFIMICLYNWMFGGLNIFSARNIELQIRIFYSLLYSIMVLTMILKRFALFSAQFQDRLTMFMGFLSHFSFFASWLWLQYKMIIS